ncbi:hypothetical protein, partial [Stenotrophomonas maltophilia]
LPANWSAEISTGMAFDLGSDRLGVITSVGYSNTFRTRSIRQQDSVTESGAIRNDFHTLITDNRIIGNALLGLG